MITPRQQKNDAHSTQRQSVTARRPTSIWKRLLFGLVPVFVLISGTELVLRGLAIPQDKYLVGEFGFPPPELFDTAFRPDPTRFWRLAPGYTGPWEMYKSKYTHERNVSPVEILDRARSFPQASYYRTVNWGVNSRGFRGPIGELDQHVILFLGSSVTFGWGVRAEDSFPALIQHQLKETGQTDWTVINAGVPGYSSYQCIKYLEEITTQIRPAVIIAEVGINEGVWAPGLPDKQTAATLKDSLSMRLVRNSNLLFGLNQFFRGSSSTLDTSANTPPDQRFFYSSMYAPGHVRVSEEDFRDNVSRLEEMSRNTGAKIYFLFPGLFNEYGEGKLVKSVRYAHPSEIDIVDAIQSSKESKLPAFFLPYDEAHLSVAGHEVVADAIWRRLSRENVFSETPATEP